MLAFVLAIWPSLALAQIGAPLMTAGADLARAPVGSFSEYRLTFADPKVLPTTMRQALVARSARTYTIETTNFSPKVEGGTTVWQAVIRRPLRPALTLERVIGQHEDFPPMDLSFMTRATPTSTPPDPKTLVAEEVIEVPAGKFKTRHYHVTWPGGFQDTWLSEAAGAFRVVKMQKRVVKSITYELIRHGTDAKSAITRSPVPHDQAAWEAQFHETVRRATSSPDAGAPAK